MSDAVVVCFVHDGCAAVVLVLVVVVAAVSIACCVVFENSLLRFLTVSSCWSLITVCLLPTNEHAVSINPVFLFFFNAILNTDTGTCLTPIPVHV